MHFITWLFEQLEDPGPNQRFAKLCWDDVNNGCAHIRFSVKQWQDHFFAKHPDSANTLVPMLINAYIDYQREVKGKFAF